MRFSSGRKILQSVLDVFAPPSKRERRVRKLKPTEVIRGQNLFSPDEGFITAVCAYKRAQIQDIVGAAKYDGSRKAINLIGEILAEELLSIASEMRIFAEEIVITPIPLSRQRETERGFNQSRRIAQALVAVDSTDTAVFKEVLEKTRETKSQSQLSKADRKENVKDCMRLRSPEQIAGQVIVVVDDVTTTGATFREARRALQTGNPEKVLALAFAH